MTDRFPMPKVVGKAPNGLVSALEAALQTDEGIARHEVTPFLDLHATSSEVDAIKVSLKALTHRQMRQLVEAIFACHEALHPQNDTVLQRAITLAQLPDVLDKFAHGD
jgi:hypothetical protein